MFFLLWVVSAQTLSNKIEFWTRPKKGANVFNEKIKRADIKANWLHKAS
jgi:hypothetical protein